MIVKICKVHGELTEKEAVKRPSPEFGWRCKQCVKIASSERYRRNIIHNRAIQKKYEDAHKEEISIRKKKYYLENKAKCAARSKKWKEKNNDYYLKKCKDYAKQHSKERYLKSISTPELHEKEKERNRMRGKKARDNLSDSYVLRTLTRRKNFPLEFVKNNPALLDIKRTVLTIKREVIK